jgi:toxin CcdB
MACFDMHAQESGGYLLDIQANLLSDLSTRVVIPLLPRDQAPKPARTLNPEFDIDGAPHFMVTQFLGAIDRAELGAPVGSLLGRRDDVIRTIDMLLSGI